MKKIILSLVALLGLASASQADGLKTQEDSIADVDKNVVSGEEVKVYENKQDAEICFDIDSVDDSTQNT